MIDLVSDFSNARFLPIAALLRNCGLSPWLADRLAEVVRARCVPDPSRGRTDLRVPEALENFDGFDPFEDREDLARLEAEVTRLPTRAPTAWRHGSAGVAEWFVEQIPVRALASSDFPGHLSATAPELAWRLRDDLMERGTPMGRQPWVVARRRDVLVEAVSKRRAAADLLASLAPRLADERVLFARRVFDGSRCEHVVFHHLDLEHAAGETPAVDPRQQLHRLSRLQRMSCGRAGGFAGVDPFRPGALDFARAALGAGFLGWTLAPGAGFLPLANTRALHGEAAVRRVEMQLRSLYRLARSRDIPLMVMCGNRPGDRDLPDGSPSADPAYWRALLGRKAYRALRICFAYHAPEGTWEEAPPRSRAAFSETPLGALTELCARAPGAYCALPGIDTLFDTKGRRRVAEWLRRALAHRGSFGRKLVFGSGYPDPLTGGSWREYETASGFLFRHRGLGELRDAYFDDNAKRFLGDQGRALTRAATRHSEVAGGAAVVEGSRDTAPLGRDPQTRHRSEELPHRTRAVRVARTPSAPHLGDAQHPADCIVIGAGIAGITAARDLEAAGRSVLVLEASERIGGRIHTLRHPELGGPVELGAELIHLDDPHFGPPPLAPGVRVPLWQEFGDRHLETIPIHKMDDGCETLRIYLDEWEEERTGFRAGLDSHFKRGQGILGEVEETRDSRDDLSEHELIKNCFGEDVDPASVEYRVADMVLASTASGPPDRLSVGGLKSDKLENVLMSTEEYHVEDGMDSIPFRMFNNPYVLLREPVSEVHYDEGGRVRVVTALGGAERTFFAKSAVLTTPIAILKDNDILLDPPLSAEKVAALDTMEVETLSKLVLRFSERFWPKRMAIINNPNPGATATLYFAPHYGRQGGEHLLTALLARNAAETLDTQMNGVAQVSTDSPPSARAAVESFVEQRLLPELSKLFARKLAGKFGRNQLLPGDVEFFVARSWTNDRHIRGGTSYIVTQPPGPAGFRSIGEVAALRKALAAPSGRLFWAGEATATHLQPWSVHGAHESGQRAAREVRRFLRGN